MLHIDAHFARGRSHAVCQDYAAVGAGIAVVCDGCSGAADSDVGARLIAHAAVQATPAAVADGSWIRRTEAARELLGLDVAALDATCILARAREQAIEVTMFGDGVDVAPEQQALFSLFRPMEQQVFDGELDVFGDGSVVIFETPGHTPGHTSLQLMMPESGPVLLTGDLYHRAESRELKRVPRFNSDEDMTLASMDEFEARAEKLGAKVIIQHEPADIEPLQGQIR